MRNSILRNIVVFSILPVTVLSVIPYPGQYTNFIHNLVNTTFWWSVQALTIFVFILSKNYLFDKANAQNMKFVKWYLFWNILCCFRGIFVAELYWDWKSLIENTFALLMPLLAYTASNKLIVQSILSFYVKYLLPPFFVFALLIDFGAYGFYLVPISFILLFLPILTIRWKIITLAFAIIVLFIDLTARSNVIKFGIPILLSLIYYFRLLISKRVFEIIRNILFITPLIFFGLAAGGVFNVFNTKEYVHVNSEI
jgi:hypothetical protein